MTFFHGIINKKRKQLAIRDINDKGVWITDMAIIKNIFFQFFKEKFKDIDRVPINRRSANFK